MSNQEVAEKQSTSVSTINFAEDSNLGLERMTPQDLAIPYLVVLQKSSPQIDTIEGAKAGMLYNTVTGKLFEKLIVLPCGYKRSFIEWKPRESGGGYVGEHSPDSEPTKQTRNAKGEIVLQNGNILIETAYQFVVNVDGKTAEQSVISMSSTQLKKARRWNSMMMGLKVTDPDGKLVTPASFSHKYQLTSVAEKNDKGSWFGWDIQNIGPVQESNLYQIPKIFANSIRSNEVKVAPPSKSSEEDSPKSDF